MGVLPNVGISMTHVTSFGSETFVGVFRRMFGLVKYICQEVDVLAVFVARFRVNDFI